MKRDKGLKRREVRRGEKKRGKKKKKGDKRGLEEERKTKLKKG